jgi:hypothetical protein
MNTNDFGQFAELWSISHQTMAGGKALSNGAMEFCFEVLADYPFDLIKQAVKAHAKTAKFAPAPADIISLLEQKNKRPTADEAWTIVPKSERESAYLTAEMMTAWCQVSNQYYDGDKIGARMGFKAVYERECESAVIQRIPIKHSLTRGDDKEHLKTTVENGLRVGYCSDSEARNILPYLEPPKMTITALIEKSGDSEEKRQSNAAWFSKSRMIIDDAITAIEKKKALERRERKVREQYKQELINSAREYQHEHESENEALQGEAV